MEKTNLLQLLVFFSRYVESPRVESEVANYDANGKLIDENLYKPNAPSVVKYAQHYWTNFAPGSDDCVVTQYDANGEGRTRVVQWSHPRVLLAVTRVEYTYYPSGYLMSLTSADGVGSIRDSFQYAYDDKGHLIEFVPCVMGGTYPYPCKKYTYVYDEFDSRGNWTKRTTSVWTQRSETRDEGGVDLRWGYGYRLEVNYRNIFYY